MFDLFLTEPFVPFTISLGFLFGLLGLELILLLIGASLIGAGADADLDFDADAPDLASLDFDFGDLSSDDFELADTETDIEAHPGNASGTMAGPASWLGIGKIPVMIWLAAVLLAFGIAGLVLQNAFIAVTGSPVPAGVAAVPAALAALWFARQFGSVFARILPKSESSAMSARHLGRRSGTVTQGTARRGNPAEVRVTDRHGNMHYLRAEPLKDDDVIARGSEVLVLRHRKTDGYRLVPLSAIG